MLGSFDMATLQNCTVASSPAAMAFVLPTGDFASRQSQPPGTIQQLF
jgi:hypothetical protein